MEPIVDPLLAKINARKREEMTTMEAWKRDSEARMEAIEAKWRVRRLEMEATFKKRDEDWIKT
jgi:hypothetical protein